LVAAPAFADNSSVNATATGDVAATDNVFATTRSQAQADVFTQVRPGLLFAYDAPRMMHELLGEVEILEYAIHSQEPSVTLSGTWRALFLPGPRSQVTTTANASTGFLNALTSRTSPDQTPVGVLPTGAISVRHGDASEYGSWTASKASRLSQSVFGHWDTTNDNNNTVGATTTDSREAGATLGYEYNFRANTLGVETGGSILRLERVVPTGVVPGSRLDRQLHPRGSVLWVHDINRQWSTELDGGVVYVIPYGIDPYNPMDNRKPGLFPVFGGLVAYTQQWGRVIVSARRSVQPNLLIAANTVDDSAIAQIALPLPWLGSSSYRAPKLVGLGTLGVERTQLIDPITSMTDGDFQVGRIDLGVIYTPKPGQTYGLRYELAYQHASPVANAIIPTAPSYFRNTVYVTFAFRYPDRVAVTVPHHTQSVRADRKDLSPVGAEPVVPDPTEQEGEEDSSDDRR
jgi:hypothetical protein